MEGLDVAGEGADEEVRLGPLSIWCMGLVHGSRRTGALGGRAAHDSARAARARRSIAKRWPNGSWPPTSRVRCSSIRAVYRSAGSLLKIDAVGALTEPLRRQ